MSTKLLKVTLLLLLSCQSLSVYGNDLIGKWRGVLTIQKNVSLTIGVTITDSENGVKLTWDSPNQGMFDRQPTSFEVQGKHIFFDDKPLKAEFSAELQDGLLKTKFTQGRSYTLELERLEQDDLNRLSFEHDYGGNLQIDNKTQLPLILRVAVVKGGYLAKLDSPVQKSFGIPVNEIVINDSELSFSSSIINASFQGSLKPTGYQGIFSQGYDFELTLTKGLNPMQNKTSLNQKFNNNDDAIAVADTNI